MPLYDFVCRGCGERYEARTGVADPGPPCPLCGTGEPERVITGFGTSRSPGLKGVPARRSNDSRRIREEQRAQRKAERRPD